MKNKKFIKRKQLKATKISKEEREKDKFIKRLLRRLEINVIPNPKIIAIVQHEKFTKTKITDESEDFINHITVNFIRHECTNYMDLVRRTNALDCFDKIKFKSMVNKNIMNKYGFSI